MNSQSFTGFCQWLLAPNLHPGDLVVMDNLSSHKATSAIEAIEAVGAEVVYLPSYSPDLNPIENIFSKVKQLIRGLKPRSLSSIVNAVAQVLPKITLDDLLATFLHCGYAVALKSKLLYPEAKQLWTRETPLPHFDHTHWSGNRNVNDSKSGLDHRHAQLQLPPVMRLI